MAGKNKELQTLNMKIAHLAKMIEIGGTLSKNPRDLTPTEKESGKLVSIPGYDRSFTEYEMTVGKLLVHTDFDPVDMDSKQKQLQTMHATRAQLKEELCNIPIFSYTYALWVTLPIKKYFCSTSHSASKKILLLYESLCLRV